MSFPRPACIFRLGNICDWGFTSPRICGYNVHMTYTTRTDTRTYTTDEGEIRSYTREVVTFPVTIDGETRDIEFQISGNPKVANSGWVFGCRRGQGKKIHRTSANICNVDGEWVFNWNSGYALNRGGCAIVAFADQVDDTTKSEHVGTAI